MKTSEKHIFFGFVAFFLIISFSCTNQSLFFDFDKPNTEKIATYTGNKLLKELNKNIDSQRFYKTLTVNQREKILSHLDNIISTNPDSKTVTLAASFAIDILINTDSLAYAVIYDIADPIIFVITGKDITESSIFKTYTEPLQKTVELDPEFALNRISNCFYNLFRITAYYDVAVISALAGSYSGGDLQKYLVAGLISGIISGTQEALAVSSSDIKNISETVSEVFVEAENLNVNELLNFLFQEIPKKFGKLGINIGKAYKNQLLEKAEILQKIAGNAGYENLSKAAIEVLEDWGK